MKLKPTRRLSYQDQKARIREFLLNHDDFDAPFLDEHYGRKKYMIRLVPIHSIQQAIADQQSQTLEVELEDLEAFFRKEEQAQMVEGFHKNTARYIDLFVQVA